MACRLACRWSAIAAGSHSSRRTPCCGFDPGPLAEAVALGFDNLLADVYWIRAVVYYGGQQAHRERQQPRRELRSAVSVTRSGDVARSPLPGRVSLRRDLSGRGVSGRPRPARSGMQLLESGIAHDSGRWEYSHDIGFVYYWWLQDYRAAPSGSSAAGDIPGAAEWLEAAGGDDARRGRQPRVVTATVDAVARNPTSTGSANAEHRLQQLDAMDAIDELNRRCSDLSNATGAAGDLAGTGREPSGWRAVPLDPTGMPFRARSRATGCIDVSRRIVALAAARGRQRRRGE